MKLYQRRSYIAAIENGPQVDGMYIEEKQDGYSFRNYGDYLLVGGGGHKTGKKGQGYSALFEFVSRYYPDKNMIFQWSAQDCMSLDGIPYIGKHHRGRDGLYVATGFNKWGMTGSMASALILRDIITGKENEWENLCSPSRFMGKKQLFVNMGNSIAHLLSPGKRCTHMGCALNWNAEERTWECPCHGSRYDEKGHILDNPAKRDLSVKKE